MPLAQTSAHDGPPNSRDAKYKPRTSQDRRRLRERRAHHADEAAEAGIPAKPGWLGDRIARMGKCRRATLTHATRYPTHHGTPSCCPHASWYSDGAPPHGGTRRTERAARVKAATRRPRTADYAPLLRGRGKAGRERTHRRKRATPISCACVLARAASASAPDWHGAAQRTQIDRSNEKARACVRTARSVLTGARGYSATTCHSLERAAAGRRLRAVVTPGSSYTGGGGEGGAFGSMLACRALHACLPRPCGTASPRRRGATHRRAA